MEINIYPSHNATEEIQNAIDTLTNSGGGKVVLNSGEYTIKTILLKSNVTLYLKENTLVNGSRVVEDYDNSHLLVCDEKDDYSSVENCPIKYLGRQWLKSTSQSTNPFSRWSRALIKAYRAKNIAIIGEKGAVFDGHDLFDELGEEHYRGPHFVNFHECENITLKGYTLKNSANWGHAIFTSSKISIENITVLAGNDGVDIMSCDDVYINNCDFQTGDDCLAGYDCCDVLVENCKFNSACNCLRIGGNNFVVRNSRFYGDGVYGHRYFLSLEDKKSNVVALPNNSRNNTLSVMDYYCDFRYKVRKPISVYIQNCDIDNVDMLLCYAFSHPLHPWTQNAPMDYLCFDNITAKNIRKPSMFYAPETLPFNVDFKNCDIECSDACFAKCEYSNINFENVTLTSNNQIYLEDKTNTCKIKTNNSTEITLNKG